VVGKGLPKFEVGQVKLGEAGRGRGLHVNGQGIKHGGELGY
jgi:hypothetical protein